MFDPQAVRRFAGKTVLVIGAARSGMAAAELLLALGAHVVLNDLKSRDALHKLPKALLHQNCELRLGEPAEGLVERCDFIIISPGIPLQTPFLLTAQKQGIPVMGELAFASSCTALDIIAVSGTNGKTTTVSLLGEIFSQAGRVVHVTGNIGYPLSAAVLRAKPEDLLIAEVSSFQLETAGDFHPKAAALLNITPDHLDRHQTMETYTALKKSLFDRMDGSDTAVLNYDDPTVAAMVPDIRAGVTWFSRSGSAPYGAVLKEGKLAWLDNGIARLICEASDLKIPGLHNIENALAATALACSLSVPLPVIAYALKSFTGVEHRIEFVDQINDVRWLNDSKGTNPDSTIKAVESMTSPTVLIAGGYDKQVPFDALAASIINSGTIHHVVLIGQTADKIRNALACAGYLETAHAESLEDAVKLAATLAKPGGNVLFSPACASFDMFLDYEQRGYAFKRFISLLKAQVE
jgi:UDP-N-acetylmuramoylalanine--D-glutamate ligase